MIPCKKQARSVDSTTTEAPGMNDLEYSLREGLRAALLLAKRGHLRQLGKLMAASANAISWAEKAATLRANILQHELDVLRDKYEPEE